MRYKTLVILLLSLTSLVAVVSVGASTCQRVVFVQAVDTVEDAQKNTPVDITLDEIRGTIARIITPPSNGTVKIWGPKTIRYTPDTDFTGVDAYTYQVEGCLQCHYNYCAEPACVNGTTTVVVSE